MLRIFSYSLVAMLLSFAAPTDAAPVVGQEPGWITLFDGKNMEAWDPESEAPPDDWDVKDGVLTDARGIDASWIRTKRQFDDFELRLEFRMTPGSNSGVFLRAFGTIPHRHGLEVQLLDDAETPGSPHQACGALLLEAGVAKRASKKAGEWQTLFIRCVGPKVAVTLNGVKVVDEDLSQNTERETDHPGRKATKGHIGLQARGQGVSFRKVEVRPVNAE